MTGRVTLQMRDGVAVIALAGAEEAQRGAGFDAALRGDLAQALDAALADGATQAVVLRAGAGGWPRTADPAGDYAHDPGAPDLATLAERIATAPMPVIAALSGVVSGGALALSQAAHWRLAQPEARFVAPEFGLGLIPAAGGLVRLARRVGAAAAYDYVTAGSSLSAQDALRLGLCDALTPGDALGVAAIEAARAAAESDGLPERPELTEGWRSLEGLAQARRRMAAGPMARVAARATEVVEAAILLPLDEALAFEAVAYGDLAADEVSLALRHGAAARRATVRLAGISDDYRAARITRVALWNQPARLALGALARGLSVQIGASAPEVLEQVITSVAEAQLEAEKAGRIDAARREAEWARLEPVGEVRTFAAADLLLAAPQTDEIAALRRFPPEGAALALEGVTVLQGELGFARRQGLAEVWSVGPGLEARLLRLGALLRNEGAVVVHGAGIAARLEGAFFAAAERCVLAGATPEGVDRALVGWGFGEGPFARLDRLGLAVAKLRLDAADQAPGAYLAWLDLEGRKGQAAGLGVYDYGTGGAKVAADEAEVLSVLRSEAGITPRRLAAAEIVGRVVSEMAAAGAAALQAHQAHRASDIDLVALLVLGFPPYRGGPMFQADRAGALAVRKRLRALVAEGAPAPVALWDHLIRDGRGFAGP